MNTLINTLLNSLVALGHLTSEGAEYVRRVIANPPSREPGNRTRLNMIVDFISHKMGLTMAVESVTIEAAYALYLDTFSKCLAFFAQPEPLLIEKFDKNGRRIKQWVTFDFLVVFRDRVEIIECKPEEKLAELAVKYPGLFERDSKGEWVSPIYSDAFAKLGLKFRVVSSADLPAKLVGNFANLQQLVGIEYSSKAAPSNIQERIPEVEGLFLDDLLKQMDGKYTKNDVYKAILESAIFAPLTEMRLADSKVIPVFKRREDLESFRFLEFGNKQPEIDAAVIGVGKRLRWRGATYQIVNVSENAVSLVPPKGEVFDLPITTITSGLKDQTMAVLTDSQEMHHQRATEIEAITRHASAKNARQADRRRQFLEARSINRKVKPEQFGLKKASLRTIQRWAAKARASVARFSNAIWGLHDSKRGGRRITRLPEDIRSEMADVAENLYYTKKAPSMRYSHRQLKRRLDAKHLPCPTFTSFRRCINRMYTRHEGDLLRKGRRAAYKNTRKESSTPSWIRNSDFPMMVRQIDGKLIDVILIDDETGEVLGRPVLTLITLPHYGSAPIGMSLMFEKESSRSACMSVRDMVERFGTSPGFLIVDNGRAFNSTAFDQLCASLSISKVIRPPACPRFSAEIESSFRTLDRELAHNMEGNTKFLPKIRELSPSHNPEKLAVWSLKEFYPLLEKYLFELIWDAPAQMLGTSPRAAFERDKLVAPDTSNNIAVSSESMELLYCPEVKKKGERKIAFGRGVSVCGLRYWCSEMYDPDVEGTTVPVRFDPYDQTFVYVQIKGEWKRALSNKPSRIRNVTTKTERIGILAARTLRQYHSKRREETHGAALAQMGEEIEVIEEIRIKERKDRADLLVREAQGQTAPKSSAPAYKKLPPKKAPSARKRKKTRIPMIY